MGIVFISDKVRQLEETIKREREQRKAAEGKITLSVIFTQLSPSCVI